jgi:CheY-like chemotaxis protein
MLSSQKRTVLIVDSSPIILYYHGILMKRLHYSVLSASSPDDAMWIMQRTVPDLVLTGTTFAHASGVDFIGRIKRNPHTRNVPVVVLTSSEGEEMRTACKKAGCAAFILKPVEPGCLFCAVQDLTESTPRQHVRIKTSIKTIAGNGAGGPAEGHDTATTLSEGGLYLRTLSPRPKNELIPVCMFFNDREIKAKAIVLYSIPLYNVTREAGEFKEPGMGLRFVEISEEDRSFLRDYIREQLVADIVVGEDEERIA